MKKSISIPTSKHHAKFAVDLLWFSVCAFVTVLAIYGCIMKFQWNYLLVLAVVLLGDGYYGESIYRYFTQDKLTILITSNDNKVTFCGKNDQLAVLVEEQIVEMDNIVRAYMLRTRRKVITDLSLVFVNKTGAEEEICFLPDLYKVTEEDMQTILEFIQMQFPKVALGYVE